MLTWNIRRINNPQKHNRIFLYLKRCKVAIAFLQVTHIWGLHPEPEEEMARPTIHHELLRLRLRGTEVDSPRDTIQTDMHTS